MSLKKQTIAVYKKLIDKNNLQIAETLKILWLE